MLTANESGLDEVKQAVLEGRSVSSDRVGVSPKNSALLLHYENVSVGFNQAERPEISIIRSVNPAGGFVPVPRARTLRVTFLG